MMLSVTPQPDHQFQPSYFSYRSPSTSRLSSSLSSIPIMAMGTGFTTAASSPPSKGPHPQDASVAQALEIARESADGASDATVNNILESALTRLWDKVNARPDSYVMTRDEFAVFNYFQHRFIGDELAQKARKRYWDHMSAPPTSS